MGGTVTRSVQLCQIALGLRVGIIQAAGAYGKLYGGPVVRDLLAVYTTGPGRAELVLILLLYFAGTDLITAR